VTEAHSIAFGADGSVSDGPFPNSSVVDFPGGNSAAARTLTFPGTAAFAQFDFLGFNVTSGILELAYPNTTAPACHWAAVVQGADGVPVLTLVTVGGATFSGGKQCAPETYISNVTAQPFCTSSSPGGAALSTNVIGTYRLSLAPTASPSPSPSASASASASVSAAAAAGPPPPTGGLLSVASYSPPAAAPAAHSSGAASAAASPLAATVLSEQACARALAPSCARVRARSRTSRARHASRPRASN